MYKAITKCRICGNQELVPVVDLGVQMLTGVFPKRIDDDVTAGPLQLVKCHGADESACGLLQLRHSYDPGEMYGDNYGYRSGLNPSMVRHLEGRIARVQALASLVPGDLVVDIGSNDGTSLKAYPDKGYRLVGIDPTGHKFGQYYPPSITLLTDFFSVGLLRARFADARAKVVTSFSMLYDLETPLEFFREVHSILDEEGVWAFEQSYMPAMLLTNSFDTICHEHLEYYGLRQIKWMADRTGFKIIDVETNDVNGGSFAVTVAKSGSAHRPSPLVSEMLAAEHAAGLDGIAPYQAFADRTADARAAFIAFIRTARAEGKTVGALGASTKGNVVLQYCGVTQADLPFIGEVNADKFGSFTPGTFIPIISEAEMIGRCPDYLVVLPWHFREFFVNNPRFRGLKLVFPLPALDIVEIA